MSTKRRTRRNVAVGSGALATAPTTHGPPMVAPSRPAAPQYRWRQFPVYFALCLGMFFGLELGLIAGWLESSLLTTLFSAVVAVLLGFGVARLVVVWMMNRNWVKPRPKRR